MGGDVSLVVRPLAHFLACMPAPEYDAYVLCAESFFFTFASMFAPRALFDVLFLGYPDGDQRREWLMNVWALYYDERVVDDVVTQVVRTRRPLAWVTLIQALPETIVLRPEPCKIIPSYLIIS